MSPDLENLLKRYNDRTLEIIRLYEIKERILKTYDQNSTCKDVQNALLYGICHNAHILFFEYRNEKGKITPNNKETNYNNIVSCEKLQPKLREILQFQAHDKPNDQYGLLDEEQHLEEALWKEVIKISGVSCGDAHKEIENLKIYRDKFLAHADQKYPLGVYHPKTAILARLAYGFNVIIHHIYYVNLA